MEVQIGTAGWILIQQLFVVESPLPAIKWSPGMPLYYKATLILALWRWVLQILSINWRMLVGRIRIDKWIPTTIAFGWAHKCVCHRHQGVCSPRLDIATFMWTINKALNVYLPLDHRLTHWNDKCKRWMSFVVGWSLKFSCLNNRKDFKMCATQITFFLANSELHRKRSYTCTLPDSILIHAWSRQKKLVSRLLLLCMAGHILGPYCWSYELYMLEYKEKPLYLSFSLTTGTFEYQSSAPYLQWKANLSLSKQLHLPYFGKSCTSRSGRLREFANIAVRGWKGVNITVMLCK